MVTEEQVRAAREVIAQYEAEKAEKKRKVFVQAKPRAGAKFPGYHIPGHYLALGGAPVEVEATELEIKCLKMDAFVFVDDPDDKDQQDAKAKAKADAEVGAKVTEANALAVSQSVQGLVTTPPPGVPAIAADALSELKDQKKSKK